ncbi:hypothetical protein PPROV_000794800 [Pycnococcus provasolii]|uniref:Uncharacterized protein n=1 Tax=Pycnococcus provasolii TaxID=41880 RepID=A0A830HUQ7_9CHLO|nr:hypothetical protein PPROV_000794800 [Pycnococcus provasolii]
MADVDQRTSHDAGAITQWARMAGVNLLITPETLKGYVDSERARPTGRAAHDEWKAGKYENLVKDDPQAAVCASHQAWIRGEYCNGVLDDPVGTGSAGAKASWSEAGRNSRRKAQLSLTGAFAKKHADEPSVKCECATIAR